MTSLRIACLFAAGLLGLYPYLATLNAQDHGAGAQWRPDLHWRLVGPFRGGRTRAATGVPGQPNVFYVGQVDGGVWKTTDYGRTWNPIFDNEPTQSIGAIAVAPSDSNIVYVASGEGLRRPDLSVGDGIYKSTDAGKTWQHSRRLRDGQQIPALAVDPRDPNRLFAAVLGHPYGANEERGIYRSTDGGQTWKKVLYKDANTGGSDVAIDPAHPDVVYACLWESRLGPWEDGNEYDGTQAGCSSPRTAARPGSSLKKGLPDNLVQINVAIAPSDPQPAVRHALDRRRKAAMRRLRGWGCIVPTMPARAGRRSPTIRARRMKIGGGDLPVPGVDSKNPDIVYSASIVTMRSNDGGKTWMSLRGAPGGDDYQNIWINPDNPEHHSAGQRPGRAGEREWRRELELVV